MNTKELLRILSLVNSYLKDELDSVAKQELEAWINSSPENKALLESLMDETVREKKLEKMQTHDVAQSWERIKKQAALDQAKRFPYRKYIAVAAAVILLIAGVFLFPIKKDIIQQPSAMVTNDVPPGSNKAVLTLANGQKVFLDSVGKGTINRQGNVKIIKVGGGQLNYTAPEDEKVETVYNTISTPRGGQYQVILSDGTKVWLNADSWMKYPVAFTGKERSVEITGEVFFDVAPDAKHPFIVTVNDMQIKVLGTQFNVNAYSDEASVNTTLSEGSIQVRSATGDSLIAAPGEQVQLNPSGRLNLIKHVDLDEVLSWKRGLFVFHQAELTEIMKSLSRWYDVRVEYLNGYRSENHYTGIIRRQANLSDALKILELTSGAHFEISNRTIVIKK
jgi:ferric-dicitrate binding protein FerR (iron transport regulator)